MRRTQPALLLVSLLSLAFVAGAGETSKDFENVVQPFLKQHCADCHGAEKRKGGIRYDQLTGFRPEERHLWTLVHEKLSAGEMPPEERKQPSKEMKQQILATIEREQRGWRAGGTRRLNRRELSAALQDLTGLSVDYTYSLSEDGKVGGFDTGADGLQDTADSISQFLEVARRAVDGVRFLEPAKSKVLQAELKAHKEPKKAFDAWKANGVQTKARGINQPGHGLLMEPTWLGDRDGLSFFVPPPLNRHGVVRVSIAVSLLKGSLAGVPNPHLWVEIGGQTLLQREISAPLETPVELTFEAQADDLIIESRGVEVTFYNRVEMPYAVEGFENDDRSRPEKPIPGGTGLFRPRYDRKANLPAEKQPFPFIALQRIAIDTNYVTPWPPASWQIKAGEIADNAASAKRLLMLWTERAWRRPVKDSELARFYVLYEKSRIDGRSFDNALRDAFQSVLLSAPFRYLPAISDPDPVIAQHAAAARLSFMLAGAPPDAELRRLAEAGKLRDGAVLDAQVDRLLDGPHADAFIRPFVTQWLEMGQPITLAMENIQKQDFRFGRHLKTSMQDETLTYFRELLAGNRPVRELIRSDWTMMNDVLALHYGYDGITGAQLRKVTLRPNDPRGGGILGHAGIQSMLCWMGENWVIYRGAWALRQILNAPPPPPPLEVPELNPSEKKNQGKPFRELLKQHQEDSRCTVCHRTIDPMGFAFQNFDLSGRWRELEFERYQREEIDGKIAWNGAGKTRPVDTTGQLPRGETFKTFAECKDLMVKHYQRDAALGLMKKLTLYATGREPDVTDLAEIRAILDKETPREMPLRDVLKSVLRSRVFSGL